MIKADATEMEAIHVKVRERGVLPSSEVFFHTPGVASRELFLTLLCTGRYDCSDQYRVNRSSYESGLILLVLSGSGYVRHKEHKLLLHQGDAMLLDCYRPHCYGTGGGWSILWLHFEGASARSMLRAAGDDVRVLPPGRWSYDLQKSMELIYGMFSDTACRPDDARIHAEITRVLSLFLSTAERDGNERSMDDIAALLSDHLADPLTTRQLAAIAHISESQLNRQFRRHKGMSPHQYRMEARLNAARYLLATTDLSLPAIAGQCGFHDASSFANLFKRRIGVTPGAYARQQRLGQGGASCSVAPPAREGGSVDPMLLPVPANVPSRVQRLMMERRYGMFLHFSINTFGNVEWSDGGIQAASFQPETVDADEWVRTARDAGMKYVIAIAKHHDGFCCWPTLTTTYCVREAGNTTDVLRAVREACDRYGLELGLYYSLWDRSAPEYREDFDGRYIPMMLRQLDELLDGRYGRVCELWLDGSWDKARRRWQLERVYELVRRLQPDCAVGVNHTVGEDRDEEGFPDDRYQPGSVRADDPLRMFPSDFRLWDGYAPRQDDPKQFTFGGESYYLPFEMTVCSREGFSWFYSNIYEQKPLTDVETVVRDIRRCWATGGTAVINMPPDCSGRLVRSDVEHLMEISRRLGVAREGV